MSNNETYQTVIRASAVSNDTIKNLTLDFQAKQEIKHEFQVRFFHRPVLCLHCRDFIYGEGYIGYACTGCGLCVHAVCRLFANVLTNCSAEHLTQNENLTRPSLIPIESWSATCVKEWLAVVNLHRYAEVFFAYSIDGAKLLRLDIYQLCAFRIRDTYHHAAILQCRDELVHIAKNSATIKQMLLEEEKIKGKFWKIKKLVFFFSNLPEKKKNFL